MLGISVTTDGQRTAALYRRLGLQPEPGHERVRCDTVTLFTLTAPAA